MNETKEDEELEEDKEDTVRNASRRRIMERKNRGRGGCFSKERIMRM